MKIAPIILLFTISTCVGQISNEKKQKSLGKWSLEQFEEPVGSGKNTTIKKTQYNVDVFFVFNDDNTLEVIYSDIKKETYLWKYKEHGKIIKITFLDSKNKNSKILGLFEIHPLDDISKLFLQRIYRPHKGIMLKKE